jgi:hypothetical protein
MALEIKFILERFIAPSNESFTRNEIKIPSMHEEVSSRL